MPNDYFQFKQFRIEQDKCAMRVSTEACILGAHVYKENPQRILDIGTGTGLVALMIAQRMEGNIHAVEIDQNAYEQAYENVQKSPWADRISLFHQDIFEFAESGNQYDLIVSNPPFFTSSLKSGHHKKDLAKHDSGQFDKLRFAKALNSLLTERGEAFVLYPEYESAEFSALVKQQGLCVNHSLIIRNQPNGPIFRMILRISQDDISTETKELNIRIGNEYSSDFVDLLSPFYLAL